MQIIGVTYDNEIKENDGIAEVQVTTDGNNRIRLIPIPNKHNPYDKTKCWFCGGNLCWQSDFNYDEFFGEGEGIVSILHCTDCGADVEFSLRFDEEDNVM